MLAAGRASMRTEGSRTGRGGGATINSAGAGQLTDPPDRAGGPTFGLLEVPRLYPGKRPSFFPLPHGATTETSHDAHAKSIYVLHFSHRSTKDARARDYTQSP